MSKVLGLFLSFIGVGFFGILLFVAVTGQLDGNITVATFLFSAGAVTLGAGIGWFFGRWPSVGLVSERVTRLKPKLRVPSELAAIVGCVLIASHAAMLSLGSQILPDPLVWSLVGFPVILAWIAKDFVLTSTHLDPGLRTAIRILGNLGYVAIFVLVWPRIADLFPAAQRTLLCLVGFTVISILYACQAVTLHFGTYKAEAA